MLAALLMKLNVYHPKWCWFAGLYFGTLWNLWGVKQFQNRQRRDQKTLVHLEMQSNVYVALGEVLLAPTPAVRESRAVVANSDSPGALSAPSEAAWSMPVDYPVNDSAWVQVPNRPIQLHKIS